MENYKYFPEKSFSMNNVISVYKFKLKTNEPNKLMNETETEAEINGTD